MWRLRPITEVFGQTDVKVFRLRFAFQDVNVMEFHSSFATSLRSERWLAES